MLKIPNRIFRKLMSLSELILLDLQNIANGTPSQGTFYLFTYVVQPDLLSSMLNVKDAQFQLLTDSLSNASLGKFFSRAPYPKGGVAALCGRAPLWALSFSTQKKKKGGRGAGKRSHTTLMDAFKTVANRQRCLLSLLKRLFSF